MKDPKYRSQIIRPQAALAHRITIAVDVNGQALMEMVTMDPLTGEKLPLNPLVGIEILLEMAANSMRQVVTALTSNRPFAEERNSDGEEVDTDEAGGDSTDN